MDRSGVNVRYEDGDYNENVITIQVHLPRGVNVHPASKQFYELLGEMGLMHATKQQDYGKPVDPFANVRASEEWGMPSWVGAMLRMADKMRRLQMFAQRGTLANESAEDSMMDIAVYSLIGLILYRDESNAPAEEAGNC